MTTPNAATAGQAVATAQGAAALAKENLAAPAAQLAGPAAPAPPPAMEAGVTAPPGLLRLQGHLEGIASVCCKGSCIIPPVPQWLGNVWQGPQARVVSGLLVAVRWTLAAADLLIEREEGAFLPLLQVWLTGRLRATCKASCLCGRGRTTRLRDGSRHTCCTRRGIS